MKTGSFQDLDTLLHIKPSPQPQQQQQMTLNFRSPENMPKPDNNSHGNATDPKADKKHCIQIPLIHSKQNKELCKVFNQSMLANRSY
jgi:hypothetical protein